jgi:hypothetical protein
MTEHKQIKKEITMKEFYREYRKLKRMQNSVKNTLNSKNAEPKAPSIS